MGWEPGQTPVGQAMVSPSHSSQSPGGDGCSLDPYSIFPNGKGADNHADGKPV